jgi:hypothetical protein
MPRDGKIVGEGQLPLLRGPWNGVGNRLAKEGLGFSVLALSQGEDFQKIKSPEVVLSLFVSASSSR